MSAITYDVKTSRHPVWADADDLDGFHAWPAYVWTPEGDFIVVQPNGEILVHKRGAPEFERIDPAPTSP